MANEKRELALHAMSAAISRAQSASTTQDSWTFFAAVAESLWWITALDDAFRNTDEGDHEYVMRRDDHELGRLIPGLRYARDRLVHDAFVTGMQGNPLLPSAAPPPWRWRPLDDPELPEYEPPSGWGRDVGFPAYRDLLADADIMESLKLAASFLEVVDSSW